MINSMIDRLREQREQIDALTKALREARQYVSDAGNDEDSETQQYSGELIAEIDALLSEHCGPVSSGNKEGETNAQ